MNLLVVKCGNTSYTCEDTIEDLYSQIKSDNQFINVNECHWVMEEFGEFVSKRRSKLILKSIITEITEL
jgi:hypothetical protein